MTQMTPSSTKPVLSDIELRSMLFSLSPACGGEGWGEGAAAPDCAKAAS